MKQNCESQFYALILQCLNARKKTNNLTPIAHNVIKIILGDPLFWRHLEQIVNTIKFIVDAIGNLESRQASLADFTQVANGRSFQFMVKIALGIAKRRKWDKLKAKKLADDLQVYNESVAPFVGGGQADGLLWWKNLPMNAVTHLLKAFAMTILSIVEHAGEGLNGHSPISAPHNLQGTIHANLCYEQAKRAEDNGKPAHCRHMHMHTHEEVGINVDVAQDLEVNFAWAPPLAAEPQDADDLLAGPETISADEITEVFNALEVQENLEEVVSIDDTEVLEGKAFDFVELEMVD
ncbi:hypothetical protein CY34DRAFT_109580 [Suillus luteus UH-Slu-Lm8-n1]|uniref:Uncharacterized protein n=1 Tax=Suillus luteus UH-Slu-Lm8-n1 TaxID=930992 RepID=A0A0D0APK5_9AGAM|nr:hypothetical protein CY34DRAFT_109580 [Suillus luteus UH-Slu-Lm8-n1]